jgi:hypothetical protein
MDGALSISDIYCYADQHNLDRDLLLNFVDFYLLPAYAEHQDSEKKKS